MDPKSECEALMNRALPFALQMLEKNREFYPYAAALDPSGKVTTLQVDDREAFPKSNEAIKKLQHALTNGAREGRYTATALIYDIVANLPSGAKSDAVAVALDHWNGYSVVVAFPYEISNGKVQVQSPIAVRGEGRIFQP
jgi:ATP-dependent Clp protease adapter protein ClpS